MTAETYDHVRHAKIKKGLSYFKRFLSKAIISHILKLSLLGKQLKQHSRLVNTNNAGTDYIYFLQDLCKRHCGAKLSIILLLIITIANQSAKPL